MTECEETWIDDEKTYAAIRFEFSYQQDVTCQLGQVQGTGS